MSGVMKTTVMYLAIVLALSWTVHAVDAELVATNITQNLTSPGYPNPMQYNSTYDQTWVIRSTSRNIILTTLDASFIPTSPCLTSYLKVYDGKMEHELRELGEICHLGEKPKYFSSGEYVTLKFHTIAQQLGPIFNVQYIAANTSALNCNKQLTATSAIQFITSPGFLGGPPSFVKGYYNNLDCHWGIHASQSKIQILVIKCAFRYSPSCQEGHLTIYNGRTADQSKMINEFCDDTQCSGRAMTSSGQDALVVLHSTGKISDNGFELRYTAAGTTSKGPQKSSTQGPGTTKSPGGSGSTLIQSVSLLLLSVCLNMVL